MIGSSLDNLMPNHSNLTTGNAASAPNTEGNSFMDKISEAEKFAKDKLGGMFGGNKTNL